MNELLNKESVKRVQEFIKKFDPNLKILVLDTTARTAEDAANSLKCELGAIVKSLVFRAESDFLICLVAGDKRCSLNKLKKIFTSKIEYFLLYLLLLTPVSNKLILKLLGR